MDEQNDTPEQVPNEPIALIMGHELRAVGLMESLRMAVLTMVIMLPWSLLFQPPQPEAVAAAYLGMLFHESGVSLKKISGWVIILVVLIASRPLFAWILSAIMPGATPVS